ncbi:MAG: hypothetical protein QOH54_2079 [Mycobacterium sp.]|nr:hypothetical protein [Mycobacterium sp.]
MNGRGRHPISGPRRSIAVTAIVLCLLAVGIYFRVRGERSDSSSAARVATSSAPSPPASSTAATITGLGPTKQAALARKTSLPVHLTVASIGVSTGLQPLKLLANGSLQAPSKWDQAGWYSGGVVPGETGPAVIAGHIDSTRGPAIFYRLRDVVAGMKILITEHNGTVLTFVVEGVRDYPKDKFPTATVYGPTPNPELRLITCAGEFDRAALSYVSNLVVSAHLA